MEKVEDYTRANKLLLNTDKTRIMLITSDKDYKKEFSIDFKGKTVKHSTVLMILGNLMSDQLTWDIHLEKVLLPALANKIRTLKLVNRYLDKGYRALFTNSIFRSSLMFGLETLGGASRRLINKVQNLQKQASKLALPRQYQFKTNRQ